MILARGPQTKVSMYIYVCMYVSACICMHMGFGMMGWKLQHRFGVDGLDTTEHVLD